MHVFAVLYSAPVPRFNNRRLWFIVGFGLAVRLGLLIFYLQGHQWQGETWEFEVMARNLLNGQGFIYLWHDAIYQTYSVPGPPYVSYWLHLIWGPGLGLHYILNFVIAAGIIVLTYTLAARWFGERAALAAAAIAAIEPGMVVYQSYKLEPTPISTCLLLAAIYLFIRSEGPRRWVPQTLAGLLLGLGILNRPDAVCGAAAPVIWVFLGQHSVRQTARECAPFLLAAALTLTPWLLRSYALYERPLLYTVSAELLWRGNNPNAIGTSMTSDHSGLFEAAPREFQEAISATDEIGQFDLFLEEARRHIVADPLGAVTRALNRCYLFWWFTPNYATRYYQWLPPPLSQLYKLTYLVLLGFAAGGLVSAWKKRGALRNASVACLGVPLLLMVLHSPYYVEGRHRVLVMPFIVMLASAGLSHLRGSSILRRSIVR